MSKSRSVAGGFQRTGGGEMENVCKRDETYGRPMHRWKDNIKMVLYKIGFYGVNWIHIHDRSELWVRENSLMNFHLPQNAGNLLTT
jgi:hypothetical protein